MKKNGRETKFIALVKENQGGLYREAYSYLHNTEDAEDAVSNMIVKAYANLERLEDVRKMRSWLYCILVNECKDMLRKRSRVQFADVTEMEFVQVETAFLQEIGDEPDLYECICRLEAPFREVTLLFYYEGFKVKEIAAILGVADGTVKSRLSRARQQLKEMIDRKDG